MSQEDPVQIIHIYHLFKKIFLSWSCAQGAQPPGVRDMCPGPDRMLSTQPSLMPSLIWGQSGPVLHEVSEGTTSCFSMHKDENLLPYWNIPNVVLLEIIWIVVSDCVVSYKFYIGFSQTRNVSVRSCGSPLCTSCKTPFTLSFSTNIHCGVFKDAATFESIFQGIFCHFSFLGFQPR